MSLNVQGIGHVTLPVTYLKRSIEFYRDVLGLRPIERTDAPDLKGAWFEVAPGQRIHLVYGVGWQTEPRVDHHHVALRVPDAEAARQHLLATGWPIGGVESPPDTGRRIVLKDPDGHVIELCEA